MTDVLVDPTDRGRGLVVVADVTHELACEILYGGKEGGDKDSSCRVVQQPHFPELPWLATNCCRAKFLICGNSRSLVPTALDQLGFPPVLRFPFLAFLESVVSMADANIRQ
jgi:hypothetical protein